VLFYGCSAVVQEEVVQCPENISAVEKITSIPLGWQSHIEDDPHPLVNVAFYSGHPRERASLVPTAEKNSGKTSNARWDFAPGDKLGSWLLCRYFYTNATYIRQLAPTVTHCSVAYKNYPNTYVKDVVSISCD